MDDHAPLATVRFFTSAALRPIEEVPGEVVQWLPRWIGVEFEGARPVTGVWQSAKGRRRVCWYAKEHSVELASAHAERHGDEPFWILDLTMVENGRVSVIECDRWGRPEARRLWEFDKWHMPAREEERSLEGALVTTRIFDCVETGLVLAVTESRPRRPDVERIRPITFPIPELAGDPYLCGRAITANGPRLLEPIAQNQYQGRFFAAYQDGSSWKRGIATIATSRFTWPKELDPIVSFSANDVAPIVSAGELVPEDRSNYPFFGVVESIPEGRTLDDVVADGPLQLDDALDIAIRVANIARRAHARGHQLGGIRPELTYVCREGARWVLREVVPRGQAVLDATYCGEGLCVPAIFRSDFSGRNDTLKLARLLWFALTDGHSRVPPPDFRRPETWSNYEYGRAKRQSWTGPAALGPLLERVLFESGDSPDFEAFVAELKRLHSQR